MGTTSFKKYQFLLPTIPFQVLETNSKFTDPKHIITEICPKT
ncbi:hypothetical protein LEP1GSC173_0706 [Leptospira interrogans str. HAI1594]|uniref:Uncharacterized protein n=11 Tax=Leptospira interrogans TaxID=173 RepID=M6ZNE6_LEPIR|nr:hypothetical protein G436_1197 [Leptospira interrogans serovar Hardjo str. Norma]EJO79451.1 hypothetical protein LEP1GSC045_2147 [Leptospira interrogans serovar Pomona str. Kennewicki LC82-25]EJP05305.1 hypothetical protein LEP1GSC007_1027 [Leptospira interrogans serovar Bulgarica str. Mallika]EJP13330.1 hypothetical protein LEP1GSC080_2711 [Leptospira interrogans str. FPW2026]EKN98196.1 hypothetical protein LEP1GSC014_1018 [Leptospira interrogans serovar Pomona str. Pomona]EKO07830.1 hypot